MQKRKATKAFIHFLPVYGCFSTGLIYVAIGVIAILSFLKLKHGGADEASLLAFLNNYLIGQAFIWIILLGTLSFIVWRIFESLKDPYNYGKEPKGLATRTGVALSTIPDALIAYSAVLVLLGKANIQEDGQPEEQRRIVSKLLHESLGEELVIALGVTVAVTALIQLVYGITKGYKERINIGYFGKGMEIVINSLAWVGYSARAIILGIMAFFFIKAGASDEAHFVVNTDKAFDFIGDHVGHLYFILVAAGTICYGLFMFALGIAYNVGGTEPANPRRK